MYEEFCYENNGPTQIFWNSYLDMVELMLCFIRAIREGNRKLHLNCVKEMFDHGCLHMIIPIMPGICPSTCCIRSQKKTPNLRI